MRMSWTLRRLFALCVVLSLVVTAQAMAVARVAPGPEGAIVLCTGSGPVTVTLDADGNPTGPAHFCPECALQVWNGQVAAGSTALPPMQLGRVLHVAVPAQTLDFGTMEERPPARGPPVLA